jgi:hypothetical protein
VRERSAIDATLRSKESIDRQRTAPARTAKCGARTRCVRARENVRAGGYGRLRC